MKFSIGSTIQQLRQNKGLSIIQFANALGVPYDVVEKWEMNSSYPDITLLSPIARLLGTSLDELLMFETEISPDDVTNIYKVCAEKFETGNYEDAVLVCENYLEAYPNSLFLKFRIGSLLQEYIQLTETEEQANNIIDKSIKLLEASSRTDDLEVKHASLYVLSSLYTMRADYDKAIEVLNTLPKLSLNTDFMLSTIYSMSGDNERAKAIEQESLFNNINNSIISLAGLWGSALKERDIDFALELATKQKKLIVDYNLQAYLMGNNILMFADIYAVKEDVNKTLDFIEQYVDWALGTGVDGFNLRENKFFSLVENLTPTMSFEYQKQSFISQVVKNSDYDFVKYTDRYKKIISKLL
ncbi:MAG TPA: helix-turn-helix transcriptional regulator [Tissierellaceae bacterium]|nr:helix-turn-helix transcriptional regulator [Tissierellaceae bacterium]